MCQAALLQVFLVIVLGAPEGCSWNNLSDDLSREAPRGLQLVFHFRGDSLLLWGVEEHDATILRAVIRPLAIELRGVVKLEEFFDQLFVRHLRRIEREMHDFSMTSAVGADILVGGFVESSAHVANGGFGNTRNLGESSFYSPKTAGAKSSLFHASSLTRRQLW